MRIIFRYRFIVNFGSILSLQSSIWDLCVLPCGPGQRTQHNSTPLNSIYVDLHFGFVLVHAMTQIKLNIQTFIEVNGM